MPGYEWDMRLSTRIGSIGLVAVLIGTSACSASPPDLPVLPPTAIGDRLFWLDSMHKAWSVPMLPWLPSVIEDDVRVLGANRDPETCQAVTPRQQSGLKTSNISLDDSRSACRRTPIVRR